MGPGEVGYIPYMRALDDRRRVYEVHVSQDIYQILALIDIAHLCSFDEWRPRQSSPSMLFAIDPYTVKVNQVRHLVGST